MSWLSCIISNVALALLLALSAWFVQRRLRQSMRLPSPVARSISSLRCAD